MSFVSDSTHRRPLRQSRTVRHEHSLIPYSVLRQVYNPFQSEFSRVQSAASSCGLQYLVVSIRSSSNYLRLPFRLPVPSIISSILPSITCFRRQSLCKLWAIQLDFIFYTWDVQLLLDYIWILYFSHDRSSWSSPCISSTILPDFSDI